MQQAAAVKAAIIQVAALSINGFYFEREINDLTGEFLCIGIHGF